jgi:hypothetical protein
MSKLESVFFPLAAGLAVLALVPWVSAALPEMRIVSGTDVPLPDGTNSSPQQHSTAVDGDSAFIALGPANEERLVAEFDKVPQIVARMGDPAPSGDGTMMRVGSFHMTQTRLLFDVETSAGTSLLLTHDGTATRSAFQEWYPDISLGRFEIVATNAAGDALLRQLSTSFNTLAYVRVPNGPDGVGDTIEIVKNGDPVPGLSGNTFVLPDISLPPYMAEDGEVVFESAYSDGTNSSMGVFVRLPDSTTLEQVSVPFPGALTGSEICCDLFGADLGGIIGVVGSRDGEQYLFVGNPLATSLALTVPFEGLPIPNAPGFLLTSLNIPASSVAAGRGGDFVWATQIQAIDPALGFPWAVLSYEPGIGLRLVVKEGDSAPNGDVFGGNFTALVANGEGGFQFMTNDSVYRSSRTNETITLERLGGPGDTFMGPDGTMVTATRVESDLDTAAFEAGRVVLTVDYPDPDGSYSWMTLVDGTAPPAPPEKQGCQVADTRPGLGLVGAFGLLLVGLSRRRTRLMHSV